MRLKAAAAGWGAGRITSTASVIPTVTVAVAPVTVAELVVHYHLVFVHAPLHFPGSPTRRQGERKGGQQTKMDVG
jgi:hypothetical protein